MNFKDAMELIPEDTLNLIINKSISAISYFARAYKIKQSFHEYLSSSYKRLSFMKTLLYRNEPVKLSECYVRNSITFKDNDGYSNIVDDHKFLEFILNRKKVILSGIAGGGKSVLCKSIFLEMVNKANGVYPIFIELRELKHYSQFSLLEYICSEISSLECKVNVQNLEQLIIKGSILLILDGFDELDFDIRDNYAAQIIELSKKYNNLNMLLSSRPDESLSSWGQFCEVNINSFDKSKAIELISKLRYDEKIKIQFIRKIEDELYDSHKSFVGNPLLLTMMLMTFQEFAEIPQKIYLFYEQAFQTLFLKHDSLKDLYTRKSHSGMDIHDFKKIFSYFCIHTHIMNKISLSEEEANDILKKGLKKIGKDDVKSSNILIDLMRNLCLLNRDGLNVTFSHRSFQEYFSALYIANLPYSDKIYNLIDKVASCNINNICAMLYEMNDDLLENTWISPKIEIILSDSEDNNIDNAYKEHKIKSIIDGIVILPSDKGRKSIFYISESSSIDSYNYLRFNQDLWVFFKERMSFNIDDVKTLLFQSPNLDNRMDKILSKSVNGDNDFYVLRMSSLKSSLDYNEYYTLIDFLYKNIVLNQKRVLKEIKSFIDRRQKISEDNIDHLLDI
ncbi:NACHT domain-containing protein [Actinobacillus equuli]|uniref:NACHT domain-containing protein n=1 Tax=Actinobacillus equuli TaxID=718 RepID=UPI0024429214|nr:NACHT domain-containing protein [Actinobacillus equuli]WGE48439.1 NACHT domain-containing protein [Actinobacillus equuli subsp. equuli]